MKNPMRFLPLLSTLLIPILTRADDDMPTPLATDDPKAVELYRACFNDKPDDVRELILSGAPVDAAIGQYRFTPLLAAAYKANLDVLKMLIDYHANLNVTDNEGDTPLLQACSGDKTDCALALIDAGADVNIGSKYGRTPLMYAADKGDDRIVQDLIAHKVALNANCHVGPALLWAAGENKLSTVKLLGDAGADPNLLPDVSHDYSALSRAANLGNVEMIDYLLSIKADVNEKDRNGETALFVAADWNKPESVQRLVAAGADVNLKNNDGFTALILAAKKGQAEIAHALVDAKADVNAADSQGNTALDWANDTGETKIADLLKQNGAKASEAHIIPKGADGPGLTPAQAYALAVAAIYSQRDAANPRELGGGHGTNETIMLKRDWGIVNKDGLLKEVADLRGHGHHEAFRTKGVQLDKMSDDDFEKLVDQHEDNEAMIRGLRSSYRKWKDRSGLAWDLVRAANIINCGYAAKYLTPGEAWQQLMLVAQDAQKSFTSWQELSDNFLDGREIWANARDPRFEACAQLLLNAKDANSPWNKAAWDTPLSDKPAPATTH